MKITTLLETNTTPSSDPAANQSQQAPKFGRNPHVLEDDKLEETTTAGAIATGEPANMGVQRRGKGSMLQGIKTSKKFPNSAAVKEGYLSNPGQEDSPVVNAITRRILLQRTDLLAKYGPEYVSQAIDDVADSVGDWDEIGSSDVSGWVKQVEWNLKNKLNQYDEPMRDIDNMEEQGVAEDDIDGLPSKPPKGAKPIKFPADYDKYIKKGAKHGFQDDPNNPLRKNAPKSWKKQQGVSEGQLDEISQDTARSYVQKARASQKDLINQTYRKGADTDKLNKKIQNRQQGLNRAHTDKRYYKDELGVAEADKHSLIGKIQRGHELKKKVDSSWKDIGDAQKAGDKAAGSRAFRKHERYANLERPGTWTKVDEQGVAEGIIDFVKRSLGFAWGQPGDIVRGRVVADYLEKNTYHSESKLEKVRRSQFQLKNINTETAKQYRSFTDQNADGDVLDVDKMDRARARKITYDSLVKNPPVLDRDGFIWDGNHRIQQAIELGLPSIPVLMQTKGGVRVNNCVPVKEAEKYPEPEQQVIDATRRARLQREREPQGSEKIDAMLAQRNAQLQQYTETGKFWLKKKDTQEHISDSYVGKAAANQAALQLLKQHPELKGNIVITAWGPGETPVNEAELSEEQLLARDLKKQLELFKQAVDHDLGTKPNDKELGKKPKDKEVQKKK